MDAVVYLKGEFLTSPQDAKVSLFDRGYLLGDSIFGTLRAYAGHVFRLDEQLSRFSSAAEAFGFAAPDSGELGRKVRECVKRSGLGDAYARITMSRGEGPPGLSLEGCADPVLSIVVRALHRYPSEAYANGIPSTVVAIRKVPAACLDPAHKTGNYLSIVQARRELSGKKMIEGLQLSIEGGVVSGTISNVFVVSSGILRTPDIASGCRPGITRGAILELASSVGLVAREEALGMDDLLAADEVFFTSTVMECLPVATIDGTALPRAPGKYCQALGRAFAELVARERKAEGA